MKHFIFFFLFSFITLPVFTQAQTSAPAEPEAVRWSHESEASIVSIDGTTTSESYSGKQKTSYTWWKNTLVLAGRYLENRTDTAPSTKLWESSLRFEHALSDLWSLYTSHGAEANRTAGYIQRDNSDVGAKYLILKNDVTTWFAELGYRYIHTYATTRENSYDNAGRFYTEYQAKLNEIVDFKYWIEYLPNFTEADAYFVNTEPSLSLKATEILSVKFSYLIKYQNEPAAPATEYTEKTFTTALVAKF